MEKKNVAEVLKELIPVAVDTIAGYMDKKKDKEIIKTDMTPIDVDDVFPDNEDSLQEVQDCREEYYKGVRDLAVGLVKYKPINKINENMDERGLTPTQKIAEAYGNGVFDGFTLANDANRENLLRSFIRLGDPLESVDKAKLLLRDAIQEAMTENERNDAE